MGLIDKFKDLFTDEEVVEDEEEKVEIKEIKKEEEPKLPTFMREKIEKEEKSPQVMKIEDDLEIKKDIKLEPTIDVEDNKEEANKFKFPIDINENDFLDTPPKSRQELHNHTVSTVNTKEIIREKEKNNNYRNDLQTPKELKVSKLYKDKKEEIDKNDKKFRATPIISPIYGVLDKNYNPEEVENRKGHNLEDTRPSKNIDFDSVRKKAYGNITKELKENLMCENCEYLKEAKECHQKNDYDDLDMYDQLEEYHDPEEEYKDVTLDEAAENYFDYGVEYEKPVLEQNKPLEETKDTDNDEIKIVNHIDDDDDEQKKKEIPPVRSSINLLSTLKKNAGDIEDVKKPEKDLELTDDLFNLIDSMYDERNEKK